MEPRRPPQKGIEFAENSDYSGQSAVKRMPDPADRVTVESIVAQNLTVRFYARDLSGPVVTFGGDAVHVACVLVNPVRFYPPRRFPVVRRDQVKALRLYTRWMP